VRLKILDAYILREIRGPFLVGLVVYSFLFLITLLFQLANLVIQEGLSAGSVGLLFLLSLPSLLAYTLPVAVLLGTIIAFGRLSSESEIVALRASGIRGRALLRAPLVLGGLVGLVLLLFNLWLVPACRTTADKLQTQAAEAFNLMRLLRPGAFFDRIPGVLIYAGKANLQEGRYDKVLIVQHPEPALDVLTAAERGRVVRSGDGKVLQFLLEDGETLQFDRKNPGKVQRSTFDQQALTVETYPSGGGGSRAKALSELGTLELLFRLQLPPQSSDPDLVRRDRYAYLYELHRRFAGAAAALLFALIGIPLGMVNTRGGKGAGFSLSLGVLLGYWVLLSALTDLALAGRLRPEVAAWLPEAALLTVALLLLRRLDRIPRGGGLKAALSFLPRRAGAAVEAARNAEARPVSAGRGIPILDRYLFFRMAGLFALIALSVLLLDWVIEVRGLSEFLTGQDKLRQLGAYLVNQSPGVLVLLTPLAVLMTVLVTFAMLERGNEVLAMKASGLSLYRISLPAFALGVAACLMVWVLGEGIVPSTSRKAQLQRNRIKNVATRNVATALDVWLFAKDRRTLYHYGLYDAKNHRFQGFSMYRMEEGRFRMESRFFAKELVFPAAPFTARGVLDAGEPGQNLTKATYLKGWTWWSDPKRPFEQSPGGTVDVGLPQNYFVVSPFLEGQYFSSQELKKLVQERRDKGYPFSQQKVDYYQKFADAFTPLVLLLLGLPFAFLTGRKGSLYGIAIALGLSIGYYTLQAVFNSVGAAQWLDPSLAAWAPTVLLGCAGGYLFLNLRT
jgi:LPS export ABC transporter permease LptF/LPS export ABC transporter permease LptG